MYRKELLSESKQAAQIVHNKKLQISLEKVLCIKKIYFTTT